MVTNPKLYVHADSFFFQDINLSNYIRVKYSSWDFSHEMKEATKNKNRQQYLFLGILIIPELEKK